ncbi:transglutaminase domain-containing protein [Bacillus sp. 31A1R]|uniref:Transglutaminase domain-containing protein n=1 Tax=Robertmurraya mangrovi TaxID=3098077 RepID=A0ABU5IXM1_9BACI|nr:transglutaminase domain-containing protein [Bacillus sp. 31A1R]MDZ5471908.1 transglutaminase domain-containing protein [Bacillus sp. 31A1R]
MKRLLILFSMVLLLLPFQPVSAKSNLSKDPNYKTIYTALIKLQPEVKVKYNKQVFNVLNQVLEDHPEIFYFNHSKTLLWSDGRLILGYSGSKKTIKGQISKLNKKVNSVYKKAQVKKTIKEKIKYYHDYIVNNTKYDIKNYQKGSIPDSSYNSYGTLVKGVAVCQGYAYAMKIFLNKEGITNYIVTGDANSYGGWEGHAWNLVKVGKKYFHVDPTWNDPITYDGKQILRHDYFMVSDKELKKDHRWNTTKYPKAL